MDALALVESKQTVDLLTLLNLLELLLGFFEFLDLQNLLDYIRIVN